MKLYFTLLAALLFTPLAQSMEWRKFLEADLRKPSLGTIRTIRKDSVRNDGTIIVVRITNKTKEDIKYRGYSKDLAQLFFEEFKDGKWIASDWMQEGEGMKTYTIAPGQNTEILIHRWKAPDKFRAYTLFSSLDDERCMLVRLHSDK